MPQAARPAALARMARLAVQPAARLFAHFEEFHSFGPPRLKYVGWLGFIAFCAFYFIRFTRPNYRLDDDLVVRGLSIFGFLGLALQRLWPERLRRLYFAWAYVTLVVALPFFAMYTGLQRGGGVPAISNCFIAIGFLTVLTDWRNFVAILLAGSGGAWMLFRIEHPGATVPRELVAQVPAFLLIAAVAYVFKYSTQQVERERALRDERQANERRLAALGDTLGFLAHELNTPLATIRTAAGVLRARGLPSTATSAQYAQHEDGEIDGIVERADRAAAYCQSLVASFVNSARTVVVNPGSFDGTARGLLDSLLAEYPFAAHERNSVSIRIEQDFAIPGRRDLVYLVLCTLVNNALYAMRAVPQARLEIIAGVHRDPQSGAERGWIRVRDTGTGIAESVLPRLTREPFTSKSAEGGTGMGLVFCRRVMESMGGSVTIESTLGEGTTVLLGFDSSRTPA